MKSFLLSLALMLLSSRNLQKADAHDVCISSTNTFTVKVDMFAGELGYYTFDECGDERNPTLGLAKDVVYTFIQSDISNYYHPMGFAYFADGAHDGVDELEPGITQGSDLTCVDNLDCPAPMYFMDGTYQGLYSNIGDVLTVTTGEDDFGLDVYEPLFFHPIADWIGYGEFTIQLQFDEDSYTDDIFYFCHIHQYMTGRIKFIDGEDQVINNEDKPTLPYEYDEISAFDATCGTTGLGDFELPNEECPVTFVCDGDTPFTDCINAMDCAMLVGMTTNVETNEPMALFCHQMIPHHQNAVNMAKALLFSEALSCEDLTNDEDNDCQLEVIAREIITAQNFQIQLMMGALELGDWPVTDDCTVSI